MPASKKLTKTVKSETIKCPKCEKRVSKTDKFCPKCGSQIGEKPTEEIVKEIKTDIEKQETRIENLEKSSTEKKLPELPPVSIEAPKGLKLLNGERLLAKHGNHFASNERVIKFVPGFIRSETVDLSYKAIKGTQTDTIRPFLAFGVIFGILLILFGFLSPLGFVAGALFLIAGFMFEKKDFVIKGMDGKDMRIPNISSLETSDIAKTIQSQLYNK